MPPEWSQPEPGAAAASYRQQQPRGGAVPNPLLLAAARSPAARSLVSRAPVSRRVVARFVAGESMDSVLDATTRLTGDGLAVTIDRLGEQTTSPAGIAQTVSDYRALLSALHEYGFGDRAEMSLKLSALGQALADDGERRALEAARTVCAEAQRAGTTVTIDMEDHTTVDSTLSVVRSLREDFPWVGVAVQSCLRRTESDCRDLTHPGSRVRLVKGAYAEPESVAHTRKADVDSAFERCLDILMTGEGYPMIATHDPALISRTEQLAVQTARRSDSFEFQMLYGVRTNEQRWIAATGRQMRVYVPYGDDWYGYFMRRLAERPANVAFFLRSFAPGQSASG
jgi:proline dehydrogenase